MQVPLLQVAAALAGWAVSLEKKGTVAAAAVESAVVVEAVMAGVEIAVAVAVELDETAVLVGQLVVVALRTGRMLEDRTRHVEAAVAAPVVEVLRCCIYLPVSAPDSRKWFGHMLMMSVAWR